MEIVNCFLEWFLVINLGLTFVEIPKCLLVRFKEILQGLVPWNRPQISTLLEIPKCYLVQILGLTFVEIPKCYFDSNLQIHSVGNCKLVFGSNSWSDFCRNS